MANRTVAEWRITEHGYIWISKKLDGRDSASSECGYSAMVDPSGLDAAYKEMFECGEINTLLNLEETGTHLGDRILAYWQTLGSPILDRKASGYEAEWFPWEAAGISSDEQAAITSVTTTTA